MRLASTRFIGPALLFLALFIAATGCQTPLAFPAANLSDPGWTVHRGQAVWRRSSGDAGLAGEILAATRADGEAFVQFSKDAFPIVVAQSSSNAWTASFPLQQGAHFSERGAPSPRIIFLQLPRALMNLPLPKHWSWKETGNGGWRLENMETGENLEVYW